MQCDINNVGLLFSIPIVTTLILYLKGSNRISQFIIVTTSFSLVLLTISIYLEIVGDISQAAFTVKLFSSEEPGLDLDLDCCSFLALLATSGFIMTIARKSWFLIKKGLQNQNLYFSVLAGLLIIMLTLIDILFLHILLGGVITIAFLIIIVLCKVNNQQKFLFLLAIHAVIIFLFTVGYVSYICLFLYNTNDLGSMTVDLSHAITRFSLTLFMICTFERNPFKKKG